MGLYISSLNSGSNGNAYYIGNDHEAVLIDAGISCRETERRMKRSGLSMQKLKAIFISHEHSDHIRGLEVLSRKYNLPVYITDSTLGNLQLNLEKKLTRCFSPYETVTVGGMNVIPFPKLHDASEPHSFLVKDSEVTVGIFTDIGSSCDHVISNFRLCDAAFLEANYDEAMLENGAYPYYLKKRIRSDKGHLSNNQALELFKAYGSHMSHLLLAHLSKDNNDPGLVEELFKTHAGKTRIVVASRYKESEVYHISPSGAPTLDQLSPEIYARSQMRLF